VLGEKEEKREFRLPSLVRKVVFHAVSTRCNRYKASHSKERHQVEGRNERVSGDCARREYGNERNSANQLFRSANESTS